MSVSSSSFSSPWPDPNSPLLSKIDFGVPLVELFKWLYVRDIFLGQNLKQQDIATALAIASDCKHPDAVWLTAIFEGKDVFTKEQAKKVFLSHPNDARALCFAWWLTGDRRNDVSLLRCAADIGNAFACSTLCWEVWRVNEEEAFRLAGHAANQHERDGFHMLGFFCRDGIGCEKDLNSAKENLLIAAELELVRAADFYGDLLDDFDSARWIWLGRAALCGMPFSFLDSFSKQVELFFSGSGNATVVFLIGRALKGNIDLDQKRIFGIYFNFDSLISPAYQAVSFYDSQTKSARLAVDIWTLVSTRLHLIKDMRIHLGKMIWDTRFEANYRVDLDNDASSVSTFPMSLRSASSRLSSCHLF